MVTAGVTVNKTGLVAPLMFVKSVAVADVVDDCHWMEPKVPEAKVSVFDVPLQIAPAPLIEVIFG